MIDGCATILPVREFYHRGVMRLIGRERLTALRALGGDVEKWMRSWLAEMTTANWKHEYDLREQFPLCSTIAANTFLFPVGGCNQAILVLVAFPQGIALITDLKMNDEY